MVTKQLTQAGVSIADEWDPAGTQVVRITPWQVQNMAAEAANGGGVSGADLASLATAAPGAPPIGYLLAAWAISYDSPGARFAHALLGDRDYHHPESIEFPSLVTTLFLADATADYDATALPSASVGPSIEPIAAMIPADLASAPCSTVANFIQNAIATVVNALKVDTSKGGFFGFLGKIWNVAVDLAAGFVAGLIAAVTRPVVLVIVNIFGALETLRQLSSYLVEWRATVVAVPEENAFGIDDEKVHGRMKLSVLDDKIPIPEPVLDCAKVFGVDLRDAGSAAGSTVAWTATNMGRADLSRPDTSEPVLDRNESANYDYLTGQESAKTAKGPQHAGLLRVFASVHRNDIENVRKLFTALVYDQVPDSIRPIVQRIAGPIVDAATNQLTSLTDVTASGYAAISYHGDPPDKPAPPAVATCKPGTIEGHYVGSDTTDAYYYDHTFPNVHSDWNLDISVHGDGTVKGTLDIATQVSDNSIRPSSVRLLVTGTLTAPLITTANGGPTYTNVSPITGDCAKAHLSIDLTGMVEPTYGDKVASITALPVP